MGFKGLVFFYFLCFVCVFGAEEKFVKVGLRSNWAKTPIHLEAAEYYAEFTTNYWKFIELYSNSTPLPTNDLSKYETIMEVSSSLIASQLSLLRLALSIRFFSPKVDVYRQLVSGEKVPKIHRGKPFVKLGDNFVFSPEEIENYVEKLTKEDNSQVDIFDFDHKYSTIDEGNTLPIAILYADPNSEIFLSFHTTLKSLCEKGKLVYVLRYLLAPSSPELQAHEIMDLQGYGVDLAIKNVEYKAMDDKKEESNHASSETEVIEGDDEVEGIKHNTLKKRYPELENELNNFRAFLKESKIEFDKLKVWDLKHLGIQASQRIVTSPDPIKILGDISQSFPSIAGSLSKIKLNQTLLKDLHVVQNSVGQENYVLFNGRAVDFRNPHIFKLLALLVEETQQANSLESLKLSTDDVLKILNAPPADKLSYKFDISSPDNLIQFVNDLENDAQYVRWPRAISDFLRRTYPGQLRFVAKNIFTVVLVLDPAREDSLDVMATFANAVSQNLPMRVGFLFNTGPENEENLLSVSVFKFFKVIEEISGVRQALAFLNYLRVYAGSSPLNLQILGGAYVNFVTDNNSPHFESILESTKYSDLIAKTQKFLKEKGFLRHSPPLCFLNGAFVDINLISKEYIENIIEVHFQQTPLIQVFIQQQIITENTDVYQFLLHPPTEASSWGKVSPKFNPFVLPTKATPPKYVNLIGNDDLQKTLSLNYIEIDRDSTKTVTHLLAVDVNNVHHLQFVLNAINRLQLNDDNSKIVRVGILHNPTETPSSLDDLKKTHLLASVLSSLDNPPLPFVSELIRSFLPKQECDQYGDCFINTKLPSFEDLSQLAQTHNYKKFSSENTFSDHVLKKIRLDKKVLDSVFGIKPNESGLITNGRLIIVEEYFNEEDFIFLEEYQLHIIDNILGYLVNVNLVGVDPDDFTSSLVSDVIMKVAAAKGVEENKGTERRAIPNNVAPTLKISTSLGGIPIKVTVVVDPLSKIAQRVSPVLSVLKKLLPLDIDLYLVPNLQLSDLPLKNYYHYVLDEEIEFDEEGNILGVHVATLSGLPLSRILTLAMETPDPWLVQPIIAKHDLDNIKLEDVDHVLSAIYRLEHIIVAGSCVEHPNNPPRGLELELNPIYEFKDENNPKKEDDRTQDTLVMSNLGYFQLKANPGIWKLDLKKGRGSDIFKIEGTSNDFLWVTVKSFIGEWIILRVKRKPGKESAVLLSTEEKEEGLWGSISNLWGNKDKTQENNSNTTIHIFSVASGHLYERFLKIMILSVVKNTKNPVKFWFLKNYLSPQFKDFIPYMAKELGFEVELVTYKWPHWLRAQTEKQRLIWGYKILFLDVLFPLNVPRVIYVDADQVVRTDMIELVNMDLDGAALGYTPFCNDRPETDGFRFWKSGYWKDHLQGMPYHISALYVIDLVTFRRKGAGDQLRATYDMLSRDPNSLSNLDQDLPNYLQHQLKIFSLPQEWLWCETWCSDESKSRAKTIDLCNNPLTKTPKLENAVRIIPEWTSLDEEAKNLEKKFSIKEKSVN